MEEPYCIPPTGRPEGVLIQVGNGKWHPVCVVVVVMTVPGLAGRLLIQDLDGTGTSCYVASDGGRGLQN